MPCKNLDIERNIQYEQSVEGTKDPIEAAIHKFQFHPSIVKMKEMISGNVDAPFNFTEINTEQMVEEINLLNIKNTFKNIPIEIFLNVLIFVFRV